MQHVLSPSFTRSSPRRPLLGTNHEEEYLHFGEKAGREPGPEVHECGAKREGVSMWKRRLWSTQKSREPSARISNHPCWLILPFVINEKGHPGLDTGKISLCCVISVHSLSIKLIRIIFYIGAFQNFFVTDSATKQML